MEKLEFDKTKVEFFATINSMEPKLTLIVSEDKEEGYEHLPELIRSVIKTTGLKFYIMGVWKS